MCAGLSYRSFHQRTCASNKDQCCQGRCSLQLKLSLTRWQLSSRCAPLQHSGFKKYFSATASTFLHATFAIGPSQKLTLSLMSRCSAWKIQAIKVGTAALLQLPTQRSGKSTSSHRSGISMRYSSDLSLLAQLSCRRLWSHNICSY